MDNFTTWILEYIENRIVEYTRIHAMPPNAILLPYGFYERIKEENSLTEIGNGKGTLKIIYGLKVRLTTETEIKVYSEVDFDD